MAALSPVNNNIEVKLEVKSENKKEEINDEKRQISSFVPVVPDNITTQEGAEYMYKLLFVEALQYVSGRAEKNTLPDMLKWVESLVDRINRRLIQIKSHIENNTFDIGPVDLTAKLPELKDDLTGFPIPCDRVRHLIANGKGASMRDMLKAMDYATKVDPGSENAKELGEYVLNHLPHLQNREKIMTPREYAVTVYKTEELGLAEVVIRCWLTDKRLIY